MHILIQHIFKSQLKMHTRQAKSNDYLQRSNMNLYVIQQRYCTTWIPFPRKWLLQSSHKKTDDNWGSRATLENIEMSKVKLRKLSFQLTCSMLLYSSLWSTWWEKWYHDLWIQGLHKFWYQENDLKIRKLKCLLSGCRYILILQVQSWKLMV